MGFSNKFKFKVKQTKKIFRTFNTSRALETTINLRKYDSKLIGGGGTYEIYYSTTTPLFTTPQGGSYSNKLSQELSVICLVSFAP